VAESEGRFSVAPMSDTPIIFKRTKSKPSQRARPAHSDSHDELQPSSSEVTAAEEEPLSPVATRIKKQGKARVKAKSTLSFGGEDEVGV
jgi:GC-rich sequence DNA-binding factor